MDSKTLDRVAEALGNAYNLGISEYLAPKSSRDELRSFDFWRDRAMEVLGVPKPKAPPSTDAEVIADVVVLSHDTPWPMLLAVNPYTREVIELAHGRLDHTTRSGAIMARILAAPAGGEWWVVARVASAAASARGRRVADGAARILSCARLVDAPVRAVALVGDRDGQVVERRAEEEMPAWKP